jgi:hypothetical protein
VVWRKGNAVLRLIYGRLSLLGQMFIMSFYFTILVLGHVDIEWFYHVHIKIYGEESPLFHHGCGE